MGPSDQLRFAAGALSGHKLRTSLCVLGVATGVAAVVVLLALGEGMRGYVDEQFTRLGTDILILLPGKVETTGAIPGRGGTARPLTIDDAAALRSVGAVSALAPLVRGLAPVSHGGRTRQARVMGSVTDAQIVRALRVQSGSFLPDGGWGRGSHVAVLSAKMARELFPGASALGEVVRVGDFRMRVIGVLAPKGMSLGLNVEATLWVPLATAMQLFNTDSLSRVLVKVDAHERLETTRAQLSEVLVDRHGEEDFTFVAQDSVNRALGSISLAMALGLAGIATISLLVAGIGIMNVMLVTVAERTPEIGVMKAVGVEVPQIVAVFLLEAILVASAGWGAGAVAGWMGAEAVSVAIPGLQATPSAIALLVTLVLSLAVGSAFGLAPALQAARLDPIMALRR